MRISISIRSLCASGKGWFISIKPGSHLLDKHNAIVK